MNIILGASGQVGSHIVKELNRLDLPVRAITRSNNLKFNSNVELRKADFLNPLALTSALEGGDTVFLLTPENPTSSDIIGETEQIIRNYQQAIRANKIKKIVGLSSIGAHLEGNTGNLIMSRMLEQRFDDLGIEVIFIRSSYFFSNWLTYLDALEAQGILPTFFPEDLQIEMNSPLDLAKFIAKVIATESTTQYKNILELVGPKKYNSQEVAETFAAVLHKKVSVQSIPKEQWQDILLSAGFTENTAANLIAMTQAVVHNLAVPEKPDQTIKLPTTLEQYLKEQLPQ